MQTDPRSPRHNHVILAWALMLFPVVLVAVMPGNQPSPPEGLRAGLRASSYGMSPFPKPDWWLNATRSMVLRLDSEASPSVIWIVGVIGKPDYCWFNFPISLPGEAPAKVLFGYRDANEEFLDLFDAKGVQVWLQVEPGNADVPTLIDLVLARYASHPSVVGFGLDVEWYKNREYREGKAITDAEALAWVEQIRTYNPQYRLFLKHWLPEKMPPAYRDGVMFLDDSQQFRSLADMVAEFVAWGQHFAPAPVGFQYGYSADRKWWAGLADPPGDIGRALMSKVANTTDLYWVDFTARDIWPPEE